MATEERAFLADKRALFQEMRIGQRTGRRLTNMGLPPCPPSPPFFVIADPDSLLRVGASFRHLGIGKRLSAVGFTDVRFGPIAQDRNAILSNDHRDSVDH